MSNPCSLASVTAAASVSGVSVVSNPQVTNVTTALPSQVQFVSAPAPSASSASHSTILLPPVQTAMVPNPSVPFQIVRRKIVVHGTGGLVYSNPQQTVPIVQNSMADTSMPQLLQIIQNQSAGKVQILQNEPSTNVQGNVQVLQNRPATNIQILQNQPAGNVQFLQNQPSTNVQILQNQSATNVPFLQNQPSTNVQILQNQSATNVPFLQNQPATNIQIVQNQPATNVQILQNQQAGNVQVLQNQPQSNIQIVQNPSQTNVQIVQNQPQANILWNANQPQFVNQLQSNFQVISSKPQVVQNQAFSNMPVMSGPTQIAPKPVQRSVQIVQNLQMASNQSPLATTQGLMLAQMQNQDCLQVVQSQPGTLGISAQTGGQVFTPAGGGPVLPVYPGTAKIAPKNTPAVVLPKNTPQTNDVDMKLKAEESEKSKGLLKALLLPRMDAKEANKSSSAVQKVVQEHEKVSKKRIRKKKVRPGDDKIYDKDGKYEPPVFFNIDKPKTEEDMEISFAGTSVVPKFAIEFCPGGLENYVSAVAHAVDNYKSKADLAKLELDARMKKKRLKKQSREHAMKIIKLSKEADTSAKVSRRKQTLAIRNDDFDDELEFPSKYTAKKRCKVVSTSVAHANKSKKTAYKRMNKGCNVSVSKRPTGQEKAVRDVIAEGDLGEGTVKPNPGNSKTAETVVEIVTDKSVMSRADSLAGIPREVGVFIPPSISKEIPLNPDDQPCISPHPNAVYPRATNIAQTGSDRIRITFSKPEEDQLPVPVHKIKIEVAESSRLSNSASSPSTTSGVSKASTSHALQSREQGRSIEPGTDINTCSSGSTASPQFVKSVKTEPVEAITRHELDPSKMTRQQLPSANYIQLGKLSTKSKSQKERESAEAMLRTAGLHKIGTYASLGKVSESTTPGAKLPSPTLRRTTRKVSPSRCGKQDQSPISKTKESRLEPKFAPHQTASSACYPPSKQTRLLGPFNFISKPSEICVTPQVSTSGNSETIQKKPVFIVSESVYKALYNAHTTGKSLHINASPSVPHLPKNGKPANALPQLETDRILEQIQKISNQPSFQSFQMAAGQVVDPLCSQLVAGQSGSAGQSGGAGQLGSAGQSGGGVQPGGAGHSGDAGQSGGGGQPGGAGQPAHRHSIGMQSQPTMTSRQPLHEAVAPSQGEHSKYLASPVAQLLDMPIQRASPLKSSNQNSKVVPAKGIQNNPVHSTVMQSVTAVNEVVQNQGEHAPELKIDSVFSLNKASCNLMNKVPSYLEMCLTSKLEHSLQFCLVVLDRRLPPGFRGKPGTKKTRLHLPRACSESCRSRSLNLMCNSNVFQSVKLGQVEEVVPVPKCDNIH